MYKMLQPREMYNLLHEGQWITGGDDVQYKFHLDNSEKIIYVIYQCSTSKRDWLNNFKFLGKAIKIDGKKFLCHRGFVDAFLSVRNPIFNQLSILLDENKDYKVVFTGHSFGGAMAKLSALFFYEDSKNKANVVTFGSPKVILTRKRVKIAKQYIEEMYNFAKGNDLVTYMPPHYAQIGKIVIGEKFNIFKVLNANKYHPNYDVDYFPIVY